MEEDPLVKFLTEVTQSIRKGCTAHIGPDGRLYYMNHETKMASWLPPVESWNPGGTSLPYGWELAKDKEGKTYFINHVNKTSTYEDPRKDSDEEPPEPRDVELVRDSQMGFGFVAGSEKPVIVRFVTEGGPSECKLQPGDQILKINGENVEKAPREHVIELVRSCKHAVKLTVCQPHKSNIHGARKSALLSAAKKAKLKNNPCRVRFAEGVVINGSPLYCPSPFESCVPFLPNVLKVFLENGQTKSFKYDSTTTVQDVLDSLREKLSVKCVNHFSLVVEHIKSIRRNKLTLLDPKDTLAKIAARPGAHHLRCLFRVVFVPKDAYDLLQNDPVAFEYLYVQCCNDVVHERFAPELKYDIALRLAALHIQQHALSSGMQGKLNIKAIERECGLDRFVPISLLETMKRKELRKLLAHFLKLNQALSGPGQKQLTAMQAKLHYLKIISELPSYGAKCFSTNLKDSTVETALLVSPKFGISQINSLRSSVSPMTLAHIEESSSVHVTKDDELSYAVELFLKNPDRESLVFSLEDRDTEEFVLLLRGYHRLLADRELPVHWDVTDPWRIESVAPNYHGQHKVNIAPWNYPPSFDDSDGSIMQIVDLAMPVPPYVPCDALLLRSSSRETFHASSLSLTGSVDHNMNETQRFAPLHPSSNSPQGLQSPQSGTSFLTDYSSLRSQGPHQNSVSVTSKNAEESSRNSGGSEGNEGKEGFDLQSVMSIEMLEEEREECGSEVFEAKNRDVIQRVTEMNQIVADAEDYLSDDKDLVLRDEDVDGRLHPSTERGINPVSLEGPTTLRAKIKAADSLLLLTQLDGHLLEDNADDLIAEERKKLSTAVDQDASPSESDTDSLSTPNDSPLHSARLRDSPQLRTRNRTGSSFGLHSPDLLPGVDCEGQDVMELLKQLQQTTTSDMQMPFAEGTFYLDPDIIDLTMIPPPMTPDTDLPLNTAGSPLDNPPLPFLDQGNQIKAINERQLGDESSRVPDTSKADTGRVVAELDHLCNALSELQSKSLASVAQANSFGAPEQPLNMTSLSQMDDIDSFIASVTVPPPPSSSLGPSAISSAGGNSSEVDDLSAFIIPPPPSSSPSTEEQNEVIARFRRAAADMKRIIGDVDDHPSGILIPGFSHDHRNMIHSGPGCQSGSNTHSLMRSTSGSSTNSSRTGSLPRGIGGTRNYSVPKNSHVHQCNGISGVHPDKTLHSNGIDSLSSLPGLNGVSNGMVIGLTNGSISGDSSGYETVTSSLTSYGEMAFPDENDGDEFDHFQENGTYPVLEYPEGPKYANVFMRGSNQVSHEDYDEVVFQFQTLPVMTNGHSVVNGTSEDGPCAPPRIRKSSESNGIVIGYPDDLCNGTQLRENGEDHIGVPRSMSWTGLDNHQSGHSPGYNKRPKPMLNGKSQKPPLPPSSPNADRARKALKAGTLLNGRLNQLSIPSSPEVQHISNGSVNGNEIGSSPEINHSSMREPLTESRNNSNGVHQNGASHRQADSFNNNHVGDSVLGHVVEVEEDSPYILDCESVLSENGDGITTVVRATTNGCVKSLPTLLNGVIDKKVVPSNVNKILSNVRKLGHNESDVNAETEVINGFRGDGASSPETVRQDRFADVLREIKTMVFHLDAVSQNWLKNSESISTNSRRGSSPSSSPERRDEPSNPEPFMEAKEALIGESRQFVTASKLFVKSATESSDKVTSHLNTCVTLLDRIFTVSELVLMHMVSPIQMNSLVEKLKEVALAYSNTVSAAQLTVGKNATNPDMCTLMHQATALATALTTLMRTLRTFNMP